MPANFRSYEGQLRLLTAVIAAHPDLRLNYKDIANHYGSDWSASGIEHFFRPIKKNCHAIQALVKRGEDPANFNHNAFQFRGIKKDAENLRQGKGVSSGAPSTPGGGDKTGPKTPRTTGGRKRAAPSTGKSTANKKSKVAIKTEDTYNLDDDDDSENEHPPLNLTPTKTLVNEDKLRAYEQMMADTTAHTAPAELAPTQAASPDEDDDDVKIIEPAAADVAHSFEPARSFSTGAGYHPNAFYGNANANNNNNNNNNNNAHRSYEEDAYDEC